MRTFIFLSAVLLFVAPAKNEFFGEKCKKLNGHCTHSCHKNEELVALCPKFLSCCVPHQPCGTDNEDD
ncbi:beta-defensin 106 [Lemur catta]|uniref:beta-defensin 106 n=1 Tax=Lemur catta TaxID=9447 RepID=UPI001E26B213|nr:beta-defensin 106 [Lemur catta]